LITIPEEFLIQSFLGWIFLSIRVFGCFLAFPLLAFRAFPISQRVVVSLAIGFYVAGIVDTAAIAKVVEGGDAITAVTRELLIGIVAGWLIRVGMMAFDVLAEVIGTQTSLSFAATFYQDPSLASGLPGQLLTLLVIAVAFTFNVHLWFIEVLVKSYTIIGVGSWPATWSWPAISQLAAASFTLGVIFSLPVLIVYLIVNIAQAVIVRVSPQLNLFSVGFALFIPLAFFILWGLLPQVPAAIERALEPSFVLIRDGLGRTPIGE